MATTSNVIESDYKIITQSQNTNQSSARILKSLDTIAKRLGEICANQSINIAKNKPNIALTVQQYKNAAAADLDVVGVETIIWVYISREMQLTTLC